MSSYWKKGLLHKVGSSASFKWFEEVSSGKVKFQVVRRSFKWRGGVSSSEEKFLEVRRSFEWCREDSCV